MRFSMVLMGMVGLLAVACGSDDDKGGSGGSTTVDSGVAEDKVANQLTDQEAKQVCESVGKAAEAALSGADAQKATCGFTAYTLASFTGGDDPAAACKMAYDECLKAPQESTGGECTNPTATCTATVGEIEKCFTDTLSQLKALFSTLPGCDDVGKDVTPPSQGTSPASCKVVQEKCPEVLSDMDSML
jgi:hypothetical protein